MKDEKDYYLTTAITYTSGKPHIGNTYEIILADAIARFKRQEGYNVRFQTGTDEHGQKIEIKATEAGIEPKQYVDQIAGVVKNIWDMMDTSYDRFMRTTDEYHEKQVQKIFKKLYDKGDIYLGHYEGKYCTACESFFTESQLVDGKCPDCGGDVHDAKEEAYLIRSPLIKTDPPLTNSLASLLLLAAPTKIKASKIFISFSSVSTVGTPSKATSTCSKVKF